MPTSNPTPTNDRNPAVEEVNDVPDVSATRGTDRDECDVCGDDRNMFTVKIGRHAHALCFVCADELWGGVADAHHMCELREDAFEAEERLARARRAHDRVLASDADEERWAEARDYLETARRLYELAMQISADYEKGESAEVV